MHIYSNRVHKVVRAPSRDLFMRAIGGCSTRRIFCILFSLYVVVT